MNVAIYVRVSKLSQSYDRQVTDLLNHAKSRGYNVVATIKEKVSGSKRNEEREGIQKLMQLVDQRIVKKVLVWEVSRLGRRTYELLKIVETLSDAGISIYIHNFGIETLISEKKRNPMAQMMFVVLSEFARMEREFLIERINSGLENAKRKGKVLGRPRGTCKTVDMLRKEYKPVLTNLRQGLSLRKTAKVCHVSVNTVRKVSLQLLTNRS